MAVHTNINSDVKSECTSCSLSDGKVMEEKFRQDQGNRG